MWNVKGLAGLLAGLLLAVPALGYDLPAVNLGFTSFVDGAPPAGPGLYLQEYVQFYSADRLTDNKGRDLLPPVFEPEIDATISLTQLIYQSDGPLGINVILPYVFLDAGPGNLPIHDNGAGFGDLLIGPYVQFKPLMGPAGPRMLNRIEFQLILPTGKYADDKELNPGSNHFSFNPYWSTTLFLGHGWTTSLRLHYLWNAANDDPNVNLYPGAEKVQPGQAWHANFTLAKELIPNQLRAGLNGYYLKQFTDTELGDNDLSGSREQVLGLGPGLVWHFSQDAHLFVNGFVESRAENRPEGRRATLRFVYHF